MFGFGKNKVESVSETENSEAVRFLNLQVEDLRDNGVVLPEGLEQPFVEMSVTENDVNRLDSFFSNSEVLKNSEEARRALEYAADGYDKYISVGEAKSNQQFMVEVLRRHSQATKETFKEAA